MRFLDFEMIALKVPRMSKNLVTPLFKLNLGKVYIEHPLLPRDRIKILLPALRVKPYCRLLALASIRYNYLQHETWLTLDLHQLKMEACAVCSLSQLKQVAKNGYIFSDMG